MTSDATKQKERGKLSNLVAVRFSDEELERLDECRKRLGYRTRSALMRALPDIAGGASREFKTVKVDRRAQLLAEEIKRMRGELNAIGRNLNQIVKRYHAGTDREPLYFAVIRLTEEVDRIEKKLDELEPEVFADGD